MRGAYRVPNSLAELVTATVADRKIACQLGSGNCDLGLLLLIRYCAGVIVEQICPRIAQSVGPGGGKQPR